MITNRATLEKNDNYRRIVETTEEGIWISDPHGQTLFVNQKMADMLGYRREELLNKTSLDLIEIGQKGQPIAGESKEKGTSIQREYKLRRRDGSIIWTHVNASPLFDSTGRLIGNLWMHTDITERKKLEEDLARAKNELEKKVQERTAELVKANRKLRQSEQHIQELIEVLAEGVIYLNARGEIMDSNLAASKILGLEQVTLKKFHYKSPGWKLAHPALDALRLDGTPMPPEERPVVQAVTEKRAIKNVEMGFRRLDGSVVWINSNAVPLRDKKGKLTGVVVSFIDITEQKKLRDERDQFTKRLMQVQEEERKRISRELHDDTAQYLALLSLEMDALVEKEKQLPEGAILRLQKLRVTAEKALQEVRRFSHELRPSVLEHFGLAAALELISSEVNALGEVKVDFTLQGQEKRLPDDIELALFRMGQEGLSNIRKHARASSASVFLKYSRNIVKLIISDDGQGFEVNRKGAVHNKEGLGLVGMRERAQLIGATLNINSALEKGTVISVEVALS